SPPGSNRGSDGTLLGKAADVNLYRTTPKHRFPCFFAPNSGLDFSTWHRIRRGERAVRRARRVRGKARRSLSVSLAATLARADRDRRFARRRPRVACARTMHYAEQRNDAKEDARSRRRLQPARGSPHGRDVVARSVLRSPRATRTMKTLDDDRTV